MNKLRYQPVNPQISNRPPNPPPISSLESVPVADYSIPGATRSVTSHAQFGVDQQNWCYWR